MRRPSWILVALCLTALAGCTSTPPPSSGHACRDEFTGPSWDDSGVFEQMPPTGKHGAYDVADDPDLGGLVATRSERTWLLRFQVTRDDTVYFLLNSEGQLSTDAFNALVAEAYKDLGLGAPYTFPGNLYWVHDRCR